MAVYEFRCQTCDQVFEVSRPMSRSGDPASCPSGHDDTVRLLSVFAQVGQSASAGPMPMPSPGGAGGGCCGGGCGCG